MEFVCLNEDEYEASQLNVKNEECCVQPYAFEPLVRRELRDNTEESGESRSSDDDHASRPTSSSSHSESASEEDIGDRSHRLTNTDWCKCGNCVIMPTVDECKCCTETHLVDQEVESAGLQCITLHEGFQGNCLNQYVLKASFVEFLEGHGPLGNDEPVNEIYRYIAYRRMIRWIWGRIGKGNRKVLPSCAVNKIRETWESADYTGFKYPTV
ncbi:P2X purinoceptor 7-like [Fundulus heteroclitus]|uniref:P2X purinoceptor 7-like n=1 Tax=Fundulus heteroclitus TaxID=8078 RepID=UPI00165CB86A|nr:P2X purinoceptor 7-like [Fundulus heteroclitus]